MKELFTLLIGSALVNNVVLTKACGLTNAIDSSNNKKILNDGIYTGIVMLLSAVICWALQLYVIDKLSIGYLQTLIYVLINVAVAYLFKGLLKKNCVEFMLAALNSAVLLVCLNNVSYTFGQMVFATVGSALGLLVAMYLYAGAVHKINNNHILKSFRGLPIQILAMAIVTLAVFAFK
ncbi:MAG: hypothetical protein Q4C64_01285 [Erysipelotrichia bacterium]|nr:hypothetical protein [Erysipelotrichia bacterium]